MTPETSLQKFTQERDQAAFAAVVAHYTPMVYGLALRRSGRAEIAVEIAQDVFLACARKAPVLVKSATALGPWLHRTTLLETMNHLRKEATHRRHVEAALATVHHDSTPQDEASWQRALPHLDEALNDLPEADRTAILLRYYSERSFLEIGNQLGRTEEAARKLCSRATEKLSALLRRRGTALTVAALSGGLSAQWFPAQAGPPAGLAASLSAHVISQLTAPVATSTLSLFALMKSSTALTTALILLLMALPAFWQGNELKLLREQAQALAQTKQAPAPARADEHQSVPITGTESPPSKMPTEAEIAALAEQMVEDREMFSRGNIELAVTRNMNRHFAILDLWPTAAIRRVVELLLFSERGGYNRLGSAAFILENTLSDKDPKAATELALAYVNQCPENPDVAIRNAGQWFLKDPSAAKAWFAAEEQAGRLDGSAVQNHQREVLVKGQLLGLVLSDPAAAPDVLRRTDASTAAAVLEFVRGARKMSFEEFTPLALAVQDTQKSGALLGDFVRADMQVSANPAERAEILTARLDIDLPADVRHAALLSGVQVATGAESFAILGHASADTEQEANFVELTTQYLNKDWSLNPAWLNDPKLGEFRDPLAAAVALTLGSPEFPSSKQNPAQAAKWLNEIANPTLRQQIERRLTK